MADMREVTMPYRDYKARYGNYKTVSGSYSEADKTIIVKLPDNIEYTEKKREQWHCIQVSTNNIVKTTDTYIIFKMPYKSKYRNFIACVSSKLFKSDGLIFKSEFEFKLTLKGETIYISAEEMQEVFKCEQEYPKIHIPEILEPVHCEALEELKDDAN